MKLKNSYHVVFTECTVMTAIMAGQELQSFERTTKVVELVREEPVLWDIYSEEYHKKEKRLAAEERVAKALNVDVKVFKTRWHNIRSYYTKELKKVKESTRSGAGTDDVYKSKWADFNLVDAFLRPTIQSRPTKSNFNPDTTSISGDMEETNDHLSYNDQEEDNISNADVASGRSTPLIGQGATKTITAAPRLKPKGNKRCRESVDDLISAATSDLHDISTNPDDQSKPTQMDDDEALFGKLVASNLRKITDPRTKEMTKLKIQNPIFSAMFETLHQSHEGMMQQPAASRPEPTTSYPVCHEFQPLHTANRCSFSILDPVHSPYPNGKM